MLYMCTRRQPPKKEKKKKHVKSIHFHENFGNKYNYILRVYKYKIKILEMHVYSFL